MSIYYYRGGKSILEEDGEKNSIEIIIELLQKNFLSSNLCFLIGSGCSSPAIPMMGYTFETIKKETIFKESSELLGEFIESNNIEGYLSWLNKGVDFNGNSDEAKQYKRAFDLTKEKLIESILIDYDDKAVEDVLHTYYQFYNGIFDRRQYNNFQPINVFTTNYDIFNELALEKAQILYSNGFIGSINRKFAPFSFNLRIVDEENRYKDKWSSIRRYVRLYKIHGSIDWISKDEKIYQVRRESFSNTEDFEKVIIYPTLTKHLDTQQTPYSELFREFNIKLQEKNTTLIVIGYGFPDTHINNIISQALYNSDFNLIVFSNIKEENPKRFHELNYGNNNFHFIGGDYAVEEDSNEKRKIHYFNNIVDLLLSNLKIEGEEQYATSYRGY